MRALFVAALFFTMTPLLIFVQWLLERLAMPGWGAVGVRYYRALCAALRIRVRVVGEPVRDRAVLFVSNHVSWADILVIGSSAPRAMKALMCGMKSRSPYQATSGRCWRPIGMPCRAV